MKTLLPCLMSLMMAGIAAGQIVTKQPHSSSAMLNRQWNQLPLQHADVLQTAGDTTPANSNRADALFDSAAYGKAARHYSKELKRGQININALLGNYRANKHFGRAEPLGYWTSRLPSNIKDSLRMRPVAITAVEAELSPKFIDTDDRGNALFRRAGFQARLGHRLLHEQSGSYLVQLISEPILKNVVPNEEAIHILQWSYYTKLSYALSGSVAVKAAYQHQYTSFSNLVFHNNMTMIGIKWYGSHFDVQGDVMFNRVVDSATTQYNLRFTYYPFSNTKLYASIRTSLQKGKRHENWVVQEIIGAKLNKNMGIEIAGSFNRYLNFVGHDALYLFNALDATNWKAGATAWYSLSKVLMLVNFYVEQRQFYKAERQYHIYSLAAAAVYKF